MQYFEIYVYMSNNKQSYSTKSTHKGALNVTFKENSFQLNCSEAHCKIND